MHQTLLNDVGPILVQGELNQVVNYFIDYFAPVLQTTELEHVTHHVVAIQVCAEFSKVQYDIVKNKPDLVGREPFQEALHDTTSINIQGQLTHFLITLLQNEAEVLFRYFLDAPLDNMVPILVKD